MTAPDMTLQNLARLGAAPADGETAALPMARMLDTDGDGRADLFLVDFDLDGKVDGVVRALDLDGDGRSDLYVNYDEDGNIESVGRIDPETGDYEVVAEDMDGFADYLSSLDLAAAGPPDAALFTGLDDPYFETAFGTMGTEVPDDDDAGFADVSLREMDADDYAALADAGQDEGEPAMEVSARVVEIEDYSGDGSGLHAKVDSDGDGFADDDVLLSRTSDGAWHGDIDRDGYSEAVAFDADGDGRIERVDTAGNGSSTDTVGAEQVMDPADGELVDRYPGDDAGATEYGSDAGYIDADAGTGDLETEPEAEAGTTTPDTTPPPEEDTDTV
ncbi:MAG: hypothetical protein HGA75_03275 [Thiobacillus sp.]|nr:hypothetical protein [Thiobacillus sp.]